MFLQRKRRDLFDRDVSALWSEDSSLEQSIDVGSKIGILKLRAVPFDGVAILIDQELLKVPGDVVAANRRPQRDRRAVETATREDQRHVVGAAVALGVRRVTHRDRLLRPDVPGGAG